MSEEVRTTSVTGGQKNVKLERYDLIPVRPLRLLAIHYGLGEAKYPPDENGVANWTKGYEFSKSAAALMRHFEAWRGGQDLDEGPGGMGDEHLIAVVWHAFTLLENSKNHPEYDDRIKNEF